MPETRNKTFPETPFSLWTRPSATGLPALYPGRSRGVFSGREARGGMEETETMTSGDRLTFRKAFFSKVFMMNGGMAARRDGRAETLILVCFQLAFPPTV